VSLAREAALQLGTAPAYWLWLEQLGDAASADERAAVARAAIARGHRDFVAFLREHCSGAIHDDELATWYTRAVAQPNEQVLDLAWLYLERQQPTAAFTLTRALLDCCRREPLMPRVVATAVLRIVLGLFQCRASAEAAELHRAFEAAYLPEERAGLSPIMSLAARELVALHEQLDPEIVRVMGGAVLRGSPEQADPELRRAMIANRAQTKASRDLLERSAPTLFKLFGGGLQEIEPDVVSWQRRVRRRPLSTGGVAVWVLYLAFRVLTNVSACHGHRDSRGAANPQSAVDLLCDSRPPLCGAARQCTQATRCHDASQARALLDAETKAVQARDGVQLTMEETIAVETIRAVTFRRCNPTDAPP
jgi:hypothetical protein